MDNDDDGKVAPIGARKFAENCQMLKALGAVPLLLAAHHPQTWRRFGLDWVDGGGGGYYLWEIGRIGLGV